MKNIKKWYLLLLASICVTTFAFAERFNSLNEDAGLSSRRCFSIKQDKNGFIWIATKLSVDRYDGQHFVHYRLSPSNGEKPENINSNFIYIAPDKSIWVYNYSGDIYKYNEETDSFQFFFSTQSYYHSVIAINNIFFENNDIVYLATTKGVLRLNINNHEIYNCPVVNNLFVSHITKEGDLFYFSTQSGLFIVRFTDEKNMNLVSHLLDKQFVNLVYYDKKYQQFWIGTFSNGMYMLSSHKGALPHQTLSNVIKPIRAIIPYTEKLFAVGVDGEGILYVDRKTINLESIFTHNENNPQSISSNSVYDLMLDKQGILWAAMYHSGISYTDYSYLKFQSFTHLNGNTNSISNNFVNTVYEDADSDLWFGTNDGLSLFNKKTGLWKHFFQEPNSISKNVILTLCENPKGKIWVGGYAFGIAEINKSTGVVKRHKNNLSEPIIGTNNIYTIYNDEYTDNIWTGGVYGKISYFNPKNLNVHFFVENYMRCFSSYNDSIILLGSADGLLLMNKKTGKTTSTRLKQSVNSILKDNNKAYWIGTIGSGLYYYNLENGLLRNYTKKNGLSSDHIYAIRKDDAGNLWVSTEDGLNKLNPLKGEVVRFTKKDGLISNQFLPNSSFKCSNGELLFGSADGATLFNPNEIKKNDIHFAYPLVFTELSILGEPVTTTTKNTPLSQSINKTSKIALPFNKNYISITFTLPNYQSSHKIEYSHFLKGYDLNWTELSTYNKATYSKLAPGKYEFIIRAYVERKCQEERKMLIIINQPWWNTIWAWIVYMFILATIIFRGLKYITERQQKKQTEEKIDFFINTAHDILTPLNLIEAPLKEISTLENFSTEGQYLLSLALNNCQKLSHFVHQLVDFQKIMLNAEQLVISPNNLHGFFTYIKHSYQTIASEKFISLNFHIPELSQDVYFDKGKVNKIIDNLLSNAIKYTPFGGTIDVRVIVSGSNWSFSIRDTGPGISSREQNLIFKHIFRADNDVNSQNVGSGIGLKMAYTLVKIHQGKISFISKEGSGSEFVVTLPCNYNDEFIKLPTKNINETEIVNPATLNSPHIFVIESNPDMSIYLKNALSRDYMINLFTDGSEALMQLTHFKPDLVITDSILSDMDCLDFCRKIKENNMTSYIPLIVIANTDDNEMSKKILSAGANDYIKKPFELELLSLKISNLLSFKQTSQNKALSDIKKNNVATIDNEKDQEFMENLIEFIEKNLDNSDLNNTMLCREFALSRTLLYYRITKLTNNSPNEFIQIIRLKNAANLLLSGQYSVIEVSTMVGIDNPKYFSRIFKKYYKVSPSNYAK